MPGCDHAKRGRLHPRPCHMPTAPETINPTAPETINWAQKCVTVNRLHPRPSIRLRPRPC
eukprot:6996712-Lingulodinium_polyedra.AAC.1